MGQSRRVKHGKRELNRLEPVSLWRRGPGIHADGNGLYLARSRIGLTVLDPPDHGSRPA